MKFLFLSITAAITQLSSSCCNCQLNKDQQFAIVWASQEAAHVAEKAGVGNAHTYPNTVHEAFSGNDEALNDMFKLAPHADSAGYELQSGVLSTVLRSIGDVKFAKALSKQSKALVDSNIAMLKSDSSIAQSKYPFTFELQ